MLPGLNPKELQKLGDAVTNAARAMISGVRSIQLEYGHPDGESCTIAQPHNPANLPVMLRGDVVPNKAVTLRLDASLGGKPSTRGHVVNTGEAAIFLRFQGLNDDSFSATSYKLLPGYELNISSFFVRQMIVSAEAASEYQVFAQ